MIARVLGEVARILFDVGDDRAIKVEKLTEDDLDFEDFIEDKGGGFYKIDYAAYERAVNDKIHDLSRNTAPKCSRCKKSLPLPKNATKREWRYANNTRGRAGGGDGGGGGGVASVEVGSEVVWCGDGEGGVEIA